MPSREQYVNARIDRQLALITPEAPKVRDTFEVSPLCDYPREYGFEFADLTTEQIGMFIAARNCTELIYELNNTPLSDSSLRDRHEQLARDNSPDDSEGVAGSLLERSFFLPSDRFDIAPVTSISQLRDILPHQHALDKEEFWERFNRKKLLRREWYYSDEPSADDDNLTHAFEYTDAANREKDRTQRASVLLDVSFSMGNNDKRGLVGRGLALAFTKRACSLNADLHYAAFRTDLIDDTSGKGDTALREITELILSASNAGMTNIQRALNKRAESVLQDEAYKYDDLLLISDGLSKLTDRPAESVSLHSFILGDLQERDRGQYELLEQGNQLNTLREWSTSFEHIREVKDLTRISDQDVQSIFEMTDTIGEQLATSTSPEEIEKLYRMMQNLLATLEHYGPQETSDNSNLLTATKASLKTQCESISVSGAQALADENQAQENLPQAETQGPETDARPTGSADSRIAVENADDPDFSFGGRWGAVVQSRFPNPLKMIVRLARASIRQVKRIGEWWQNR